MHLDDALFAHVGGTAAPQEWVSESAHTACASVSYHLTGLRGLYVPEPVGGCVLWDV